MSKAVYRGIAYDTDVANSSPLHKFGGGKMNISFVIYLKQKQGRKNFFILHN